MPTTEPRIDAYIEKSAEFAQPILRHLRDLVHNACPDVEEKIKWGMPHFDFKGSLCHMASFKQHCAFGFWKQPLLGQDAFPADKTVIGGFGRIETRKHLPSDKVLVGLIRQAMKLTEKGIKLPKKQPPAKTAHELPEALAAALKKNKKAADVFENFPPGKRKDYVVWINDAKTDATREKRLATAIEWISEGKGKNWKYEQKK
ncbi:MAG: YdeI/OmpD-associated family protein [Blastocatellia bacterium]|nr:YdeI/OmpD-associated family protein [Blastocatellia bacterium]